VVALNTIRAGCLVGMCLGLAVGCTTTPRGSFCEIAEPIRPANVDVLTDAEVKDILTHNAQGAALCGWKT
jgi:hypothetical protein